MEGTGSILTQPLEHLRDLGTSFPCASAPANWADILPTFQASGGASICHYNSVVAKIVSSLEI